MPALFQAKYPIKLGERYGRLVVKGWLIVPPLRYACECDCGRVSIARGANLHQGKTVSCGCSAHDKLRVRNVRHGLSSRAVLHPLYKAWSAMLQRCENPDNPAYRYYGALGVSVCDRWQDFAAFLQDVGERPDGMSLDRINPFGNYEPSNVRWATPKQQTHNTRKRWLREGKAS